MVVADISLKESDDNSATFEVTSGFGTNGLGSGNLYPWYWGWELGRCDGSSLGVGFDAADKIAQLANYTIPTHAPYGYYTDNVIRNVYPYDYEDDEGNPMLFADFQEYEIVHACLSTTDIATYKSNLIYIKNQEAPPGKSVINYILYDATAFASCNAPDHDCWYLEHWAEIEYGIWHASSEPPSPL